MVYTETELAKLVKDVAPVNPEEVKLPEGDQILVCVKRGNGRIVHILVPSSFVLNYLMQQTRHDGGGACPVTTNWYLVTKPRSIYSRERELETHPFFAEQAAE